MLRIYRPCLYPASLVEDDHELEEGVDGEAGHQDSVLDKSIRGKEGQPVTHFQSYVKKIRVLML